MARKRIKNNINRINAQHSTGPRTEQGKQRSRLNAFKHGLTGQYLVLAEHEHEAYYQFSERMRKDVDVRTEPERQLLSKIIDLHFRLNRLSSIESNMYTVDSVHQTPQDGTDDRVALMQGQARAWKEDAHSFDLLGRYEARLSKQMLQYQHELERLQADRPATAESTLPNPAPAFKAEEPPYEDDEPATLAASASQNVSQPSEIKPLDPKMASFRKTPVAPVPATAPAPQTDRKPLSPPARLRVPSALEVRAA